MNVKAKRITTIAMLCALAYVVMAVGPRAGRALF